VVAVLDVAWRPGAMPPVPVLARWADLDDREVAADIPARHPILIDPEHRIDPVLARFLARSRFTWLADGTKEAYAKDYRLFFSFLWHRQKYCEGASMTRDASIMRALLPMVISLGRRWLLAGQCRRGAARPARWFRELPRWSGGNGGNWMCSRRNCGTADQS
jgi:hypothetical protein